MKDMFPILIKDQCIASTLVDAHGEKFSKQFFEKLVTKMGGKFPLGRTHNISSEQVGYMENFRIVPVENKENEWDIVADIYLSKSASLDDALKGFSWSFTEIYVRSKNEKGCVFLPYPYYNDSEVMKDVLSDEEGISVGKWYKKEFELSHIGLITSLTLFFFGPEWRIQYNENIRPFIISCIEKCKNKFQGKIYFDYSQRIKLPNGNIIYVYFIPYYENNFKSLDPSLIEKGMEYLKEWLEKNYTGESIYLFKLQFDIQIGAYQLLSVQYHNGTIKRYQ